MFEWYVRLGGRLEICDGHNYRHTKSVITVGQKVRNNVMYFSIAAKKALKKTKRK